MSFPSRVFLLSSSEFRVNCSSRFTAKFISLIPSTIFVDSSRCLIIRFVWFLCKISFFIQNFLLREICVHLLQVELVYRQHKNNLADKLVAIVYLDLQEFSIYVAIPDQCCRNGWIGSFWMLGEGNQSVGFWFCRLSIWLTYEIH